MNTAPEQQHYELPKDVWALIALKCLQSAEDKQQDNQWASLIRISRFFHDLLLGRPELKPFIMPKKKLLLDHTHLSLSFFEKSLILTELDNNRKITAQTKRDIFDGLNYDQLQLLFLVEFAIKHPTETWFRPLITKLITKIGNEERRIKPFQLFLKQTTKSRSNKEFSPDHKVYLYSKSSIREQSATNFFNSLGKI